MTNKQIIEQCSERFYSLSNAALAQAEDLEQAGMLTDEQERLAIELRYTGTRNAIIAYALIGTTAPSGIVGREASRDVRAAMREIVAQEHGRVGRLNTLISFTPSAPLRVTVQDLRVMRREVTVNIGRFLEELKKASDGSGADSVMFAALRATLPYEPPTTTTTQESHYED